VKKCGLMGKSFFGKIFNMSITFRPKKRKRKKTHGFLTRKRKGVQVLKRRRKKKRWRLVV